MSLYDDFEDFNVYYPRSVYTYRLQDQECRYNIIHRVIEYATILNAISRQH